MKIRVTTAALLIGVSSMQPVFAQSPKGLAPAEDSAPKLGDIMSMVQARHIKLWFAGKLRNWDLAAYELAQFRAGIADAAALYPGIPVSNVTTMTEPIHAIAAAIVAKDAAGFASGFDKLTAECNECHRSLGRGFITIQVPAVSPFSDQVFAPPKR